MVTDDARSDRRQNLHEHQLRRLNRALLRSRMHSNIVLGLVTLHTEDT